MDYIIPIVTEDYLWQIAPRKNDEDDADWQRPESTSIDAQYARLIYVMMLEEYQRNRCLNFRVRPIESGALNKKKPYLQILMWNPLFQCRKTVSQVGQLASVLANAKTRTRLAY